MYHCNIKLPYRIRKVVENISIRKELWDGDGPLETIRGG